MNTSIQTPIVFAHTHHSHKRASQRGIEDNSIELLMKYGSVIKKQGLRFYFITKEQLKYMGVEQEKSLKNLVAVCSADHALITCYKSENAIKRIKQKSKYLK